MRGFYFSDLEGSRIGGICRVERSRAEGSGGLLRVRDGTRDMSGACMSEPRCTTRLDTLLVYLTS